LIGGTQLRRSRLPCFSRRLGSTASLSRKVNASFMITFCGEDLDIAKGAALDWT
jgi:hypothetical protein